jgi:hypothetical protein
MAHPEPGPPFSEVDYRPRHVSVATLIRAHTISVGEAEDLCYLLSIDEIAGVHVRRHTTSLRELTSIVRGL